MKWAVILMPRTFFNVKSLASVEKQYSLVDVIITFDLFGGRVVICKQLLCRLSSLRRPR